MSSQKILHQPFDQGRRSPTNLKEIAHPSLTWFPWVFTVLATWILARLLISDPSLIPSPLDVGSQAITLLQEGALQKHWMASAARVLIGVFLGVLVALPVGFVLGWYRAARKFVSPALNFFRALPPIALIPLVIIYFGIGESAKILVLFYASFFTSIIVIYEGISHISPIYLNVARMLGATDRELFVKVVLPLALPHILTATRVALGVSWMTLVAAEMIAAQHGLGAMIQLAASYFQLDVIYLGIIVIGFTALVMDVFLVRVSARLIDWQEKVRS